MTAISPPAPGDLTFSASDDGFTLSLAGQALLRHTPEAPCVFAGVGEATIAMHRGNFDISDYIAERTPLRHVTINGALLQFRRHAGDPVLLALELQHLPATVTLHVRYADPRLNRFWFRIAAEPREHVWGCGEQMSYFDLRGRRFPLWTSEPGVGRDPTSLITFQANAGNHSGGDYYTTNYPQPAFISSRCYAAHVETTAYSAFDFRHETFHELEIWEAPQRLEFLAASGFATLIERVSARFGRQPRLPDWLYNGAIIGLKDGSNSFARLEKYLQAGACVSALWCEDWAGVRTTSFGTRLFWDWRWNPSRYPDLPKRIAELRARNIRFMGYANPYLCTDGTLYQEAAALGLLARGSGAGPYHVDFGEFTAGIVDFTNPMACEWFATRVLCTNMLDLGLSGWMADFGEYLPIDARLMHGDAKRLHNAWPALWAEVNANAIAHAGRTGDALFFMRAGYTGVQRFCPLLWAGDQCVDFSRHDGLPSVICGALSSGLLGNAYHHSDIGGYTSLFGNVRTPELLMRWTEMAAFTPVMRTHEGNRPRENLQIDQSPDVLAHFARFTRIWCHLAPYLCALSEEAATRGLPVQRPLFLHFPDDSNCYAMQDQYLYGPDLLVAPVQRPGVTEWSVHLPAGADWTHLWSGTTHRGGVRITPPAPIGQPPVFYRKDSNWAALFQDLRD
ncbi:MAG TPA: alpha-glucosidase [Acetobacteraceae bacterium]|nr:alpha-glucosidase [Acetobacteraceae bacterium]